MSAIHHDHPQLAEPYCVLPLEVDVTSDDPAIRGLSWDLVLGQQKTIERLQHEQGKAAEHQRAMEERRLTDELSQREHDRAIELARVHGEERRRGERARAFYGTIAALTLLAFAGAGIRFRGYLLGLSVATPTIPTAAVEYPEEPGR